MDLTEHWRGVAGLLAEALEGERARLGAAAAGVVDDYLTANELGLAHDQLIDALGDAELAPLPATARLLAEAGRRMNHRR